MNVWGGGRVPEACMSVGDFVQRKKGNTLSRCELADVTV